MKQDLMHKDVHDVNITPEERRNIWQLWRQNLKDWVWYTQENPDWLDPVSYTHLTLPTT